ncbi:hypothetical protein [Pseudomonas sp. MH10]|nr:hypothetical protein [Pseudomonas sp. MH10]MEB0041303.1 hypothetical protein [Pseudomonas sp. MH10]WPX63801.1 hypothetical protein RHM59_23520 [Pseudomonas sp. MH10]
MPIVLELDLSDPAEISGRYFYEKYHADLALSGVQEGKELTLAEGMDDDSGKILPEIDLHQTAQDGWQGQWTVPGTEGKTLKVVLTEKQFAPPPADAEPGWQAIFKKSPYDYLRLRDMSLQPGKVQTFMGYTLQWWTEPESKVSMFEVTSGYPPQQGKLINQQLRARLWDEVVSYHACLLQGSRFGADFQQTVTPELLSPAIVSVSVFTRYDCGGAHPDFGDTPLNLDATTGKPLSLEDVLWVGDGNPFHYEDHQSSNEQDASSVSFDTFAEYRSKQFAPWLVGQLQAAAPVGMKTPNAEYEDNCDFNDPDIWDFPAWYFKPKGLYFGPSFARVMRACEGPDWSVLPYSAVAPHPGSVALELPK